ncbi:MAG: hypothetical protein IPG53_18745 [Ignavibacteriales bacterium]|nr:hypothetical protein [Ignavibacteriales bacterium]
MLWSRDTFTGTLDMHIELEEKMAKVLMLEAKSLLNRISDSFRSLPKFLFRKALYYFLQRQPHACIVTGNLLIAKGSMVEMVRYKHNDMHDL